MDGADQVGQPGLAYRPRRWRPSGPGVISRPRDPQGMAGPPGPHTLSVQFRDQAVAAYWAHHRLHRGLPQDLHFLFQVADPGPGPASSALSRAVVLSFRLQSTRSRCRHRCVRLSDPSDAAISRAVRPDSTRSRAAAEFEWIRSRHRPILSDCRAPVVSRHVSPPNRVKINVSTYSR
jgi:hypothetical protein